MHSPSKPLALAALFFAASVLPGSAEENRSPDFSPPPPPQRLGAEASADIAHDFAAPPGLPSRPWFRDEFGRHFLPNGVVLNTEDTAGDYDYPDAAFRRLRSYGFNVQVVRLGLTRLGGFPGSEFKPEYGEKIARMVRLGAENGVKTIFKLTLYDLTGEVYLDLTEDHWAALFLNRDGLQDRYVEAWARVFRQYAGDPAVWGYDLLNEPLAATGGAKTNIWETVPEFRDREHFLREYFWPLYRRVIGKLREISPEKWALVQSWHRTVADHIRYDLPSGPPGEGGVTGERIVLAPHYYGRMPGRAVKTYLEEAAALGLPVIMGEYGPPTFDATDSDLETRLVYEANFIRTVSLFDRFALGQIKAWWSGSRDLVSPKLRRTWALFAGMEPGATGPERKYVVDTVCRPRPLNVAGVVRSFGFDFGSRVFSMAFEPGRAEKPSEIFIPVNRHYPDGARVVLGEISAALPADAPSGKLRSVAGEEVPWMEWDPEWQRLRVSAWPAMSGEAKLEILPGAPLR
jgi:hypothetical protein